MRPKLERALTLIINCRIGFKKLEGSTCIISALTVRDFLHSVGFEAECRPVVLSSSVVEAGGQVREVLCGGRALVGPEYGKQTGPVGWDGHLVVVLPEERLLVDPSFGQFRRPWCEWLPDVAVVRMVDGPVVNGLPVIAGYRNERERYHAVWALNQANRKWIDAPAARKSIRAPIVKSLKREFKKAA
jgi:hypothetical protein